MGTDSAADALFGELRERIAVERALGRAEGQDAAPAFGTLRAQIDQLGHFARVGESLPSFEHLGIVRRGLARLSGRVALYFMRLVTLDQQRFNGLAVRTLRGLQAKDRELHRELHELPDQLALVLRERDQRIDHLEHELAARDRALAALGERTRALEGSEAERERAQAALLKGVDDLRIGAALVRTQLEALQRRVRAAPATSGSPAGVPAAPTDVSAPPPGALLTADLLRGGEDEIAARQERYVRCFAGRGAVLDVGCGRGEFLAQLREAGIGARGVDADLDMVLRCREKGLDVTQGDALAHLAALPDGSLDGIFCAQVVEHWRTPVLLGMVREAARVLAPGAPLVIETLNPESLLVLYRWFWVDLTHERLVHPDALDLLLRGAGFAGVERLDLPPPPGPIRLPLLSLDGAAPEALAGFNAATQYLNDLLYASYDYALVATR